MHVLEAALFSNLSVQKKRIVEETDNYTQGTTTRSLAALVAMAVVFCALEMASPARPAELAAQADAATMRP